MAELDAEIERLARALALSRRFHFYVVTTPLPLVADAVFARLERALSGSQNRPSAMLRLAPRVTDGPLAREVLAEDVLTPLATAAAGNDTVYVIDASRSIEADDSAWEWFFQRWNEQRNAIQARLRSEIVMFLPPRLIAAFRKHAPDVWSIRSGEYSPDLDAFHAAMVDRSVDIEALLSELLDEGSRGENVPARRPFPWMTLEAAPPVEDFGNEQVLVVETLRAADAAAEREEIEQARELYLRACRRIVALAAHYPELDWENLQLSAGLSLGQLEIHTRRYSPAEQAFELAAVAAERLYEKAPRHAEKLRDLASCNVRLAEARYWRGNAESASALLKSTHELLQPSQGRRRFPSLVRSLAVVLHARGQVALASGSIHSALDLANDALITVQSWFATPRPWWLRLHTTSELLLARVLLARGELDEARAHALRVMQDPEGMDERPLRDEKLSASIERLFEWDQFRAWCLIARIDVQRGDLQRAEKSFERALSNVPSLDPIPPAIWRNREVFMDLADRGTLRSGVAEAHDQFADLLVRLERPREARVQIERAIAILETVVSEYPDVPYELEALGEARAKLASLR